MIKGRASNKSRFPVFLWKMEIIMILERFYPDFYLDSAYKIDYRELYEAGYRGIIFDVDNTLVPHGSAADKKSILFFEQLANMGFSVLLLSNNKELRVKKFGQAVKAKYIHKAGKPGVRGYQKAMEIMSTNTKNTIFVGDQLFTDVWGAKRAGIRSYLVKPIHPKEEIQIVLKRKLEKIVLYFYKKSLK